jgi:hypothetical protein
MSRVKANDIELYYQEAGTGREPLKVGRASAVDRGSRDGVGS